MATRKGNTLTPSTYVRYVAKTPSGDIPGQGTKKRYTETTDRMSMFEKLMSCDS